MDLWELKQKMESAEQGGRDLLSEMAKGVDTRIGAARERLARVAVDDES
jgi:hypothetical protein